MTDAEAGDTVRALTRRATGRLRAQRLLEDAPLAACAALAGWLAAPVAGGAAAALRGGALLLAGAWLIWRTARRLPALRVAAEADRRAGLSDALLTAEWFLERDAGDAWILHQRRVAADAAARLDAARLFPLRVPPVRTGAALVLAVVALAGFGGARSARGGAAAGAGGTGVPDPGAAPEPVAARPPVPEPGADSVADALPAPADLEALAEALRAGLTEEALARLRELASRAEAARGDADATGDAASEAEALAMSADDVSEALAEAAAALARGDEDAAARALEEAAEAAQAKEGEQRQRADEGSRRASSSENPDASQVPVEAGVRWSLDAFEPQAGAQKAQQSARGDAAGPPGGQTDPELGDPTEMEVELEREALTSQSGKDTEPIEITEEASREQGSRVGRAGRAAGRYEAAAAQDAAAVPWSDRERVRRYLLALTAEERQR